MEIACLGEPMFASPVRRSVDENLRIPENIVHDPNAPISEELLFEMAGPRARLFFDPGRTRAGIVTCGGRKQGQPDPQ